MISAKMTNIGNSNGFQVEAGYSFGYIGNLLVTLSDGMGTKIISIYAGRAEDTDESGLAPAQRMKALIEQNIPDKKTYLLGGVEPAANGRAVRVIFQDTLGTPKRVEKFISEVLPLLDAAGFNGHACAVCAQPCQTSALILSDDAVLPAHGDCVDKADESRQTAANDNFSIPESKHLLRGTLGALAGSILGAVVWAVVAAFGYILSAVGLLIGFLSSKFYDLFGGKNCRAKLVIVILCVIIGVLLGNVFSLAYELSSLYDELVTEVASSQDVITKAEFIRECLVGEINIWQDSEVIGELAKNLLLGLVFAFVGCYSMFRGLNREVNPDKIKRLSATL